MPGQAGQARGLLGGAERQERSGRSGAGRLRVRHAPPRSNYFCCSGGHRAAAGLTLPDDLPTTIERVLAGVVEVGLEVDSPSVALAASLRASTAMDSSARECTTPGWGWG